MPEIRPVRTAELMTARLPIGTGAQMDKVLKGGEVRGAFIRAAILAEIQRRQKALQKVEA